MRSVYPMVVYAGGTVSPIGLIRYRWLLIIDISRSLHNVKGVGRNSL